jgi:crotonobetainyl-CoA:carnitine CoA-transferase CaiB-like acyl-CoA transferase
MAGSILNGITVVDMTEGVAGPYASMLLGDMGADVIKVERPDGDWGRTTGRGRIAPAGGAQFIAINRNKRNVGLDAGTSGGREIIERLVARADVLVSNYRVGVMARLGLEAAHCRAINPDLIYCTISGFGQDGPYARTPASDTILQAVSGIMSLVGEADGPPLRVGFPLVDMTAANHAVQAVLLALYGRLKGSRGAVIDVSLMSAALALMTAAFTDHAATGRLPQRQGNQNASLAPAGAFKVAGGRWIVISVLRDEHWQKLCAALDLAHLADDVRFGSNELRVRNRAEFDRVLAPMLASNSSEYWLERLRAADILCGPVNSLADVMADPALMAALPLVDPLVPGVSSVIGAPFRYDGAVLSAQRPPPERGQHTREVLAGLGFSEDEIGRFLREGAAFARDKT